MEHVVVEPKRLGRAGLDREHGEAHLTGQELREPVLHAEELGRTVRRLAERDDVASPMAAFSGFKSSNP